MASASSGRSVPRTQRSGGEGVTASNAGYCGSPGTRAKLAIAPATLPRVGAGGQESEPIRSRALNGAVRAAALPPQSYTGGGSEGAVEAPFDDLAAGRDSAGGQKVLGLCGGLGVGVLLHDALPGCPRAGGFAEIGVTEADLENRLGRPTVPRVVVENFLEFDQRLAPVPLNV